MSKAESRELEPKTPTIILRGIISEADPGFTMPCAMGDCDGYTSRKQIDYPLTLNNQLFVAANVWANVCSKCGEVYFDADVSHAILEDILEIQHPERAHYISRIHFAI